MKGLVEDYTVSDNSRFCFVQDRVQNFDEMLPLQRATHVSGLLFSREI